MLFRNFHPTRVNEDAPRWTQVALRFFDQNLPGSARQRKIRDRARLRNRHCLPNGDQYR